MAIKGKKKSQSRGSQARRRPATAPRPGYASRGPVLPWYKTAAGQVGAGIGLVLVAGAIVAAIAVVRGNSAEFSAEQELAETYTGQVEATLELVNPLVAEMVAVPLDPAGLGETVRADVRRWKAGFEDAQTQLAGTLPPPALEPVTTLLAQSIQGYSLAADTYALVPRADEAVQADLLRQAAAQRDQATGIWSSAIAFLDEERADLEMTASRVDVPGVAPQPTPGEIPVDTQTVPVQSGTDDGEGSGKKKGGGSGGGRK